MTLNEIRQEGLKALRDRLGPEGMLRFLQHFESGKGDYAHERQKWAKTTSMDDLLKQMDALPTAHESPKARPRRSRKGSS